MTFVRRLSSARLTWALLIVSLAMRALVPVGYMAGQGDDGGLTVQLCTATGMQEITLPAGEQGPAAPNGHGDSTCLFALAAGAALPSLPWAAAAAPATLVSFVRVASSLVHLPAIVRAQSSRGPPAPLPA